MTRQIASALVIVITLAAAALVPRPTYADPPPASSRGGVIEGRLLDAGGSPVAGIEVALSGALRSPERRVATTASDGTFHFEGVPAPGTYVLTSSTADGAAQARRQLTIGGDLVTSVDLHLQLVFSDAVTVTGSREAQPKRETPATVGTIARDRLDQVKAAHPSEVLGSVPGVWVNTTGGEGHMTAIRQPLTTNPVYLFLEDGVPTRSTGFFNHNALYEVDVPGSDGIEVTKGPGSALYGSDAIGGVINVLTRSALGPSSASGRFDGGGSGWRRLVAGGSAASGANGVRLGANLTLSDGWRDATGYDRLGGTVRWDHTGASSHWKTLVAFNSIDQQTAGSSTLQVDDYQRNPTRNLTPISFRKVKALRVSTDYERATGAVLVSLIPYARYNMMQLLANWSLTYDPTVYSTENTSFGVLAKVRRDFAMWRTQVIAGFDLDVSPGSHVENQIAPVTEKTSDGKTIFASYTSGPLIYDYDVRFTGLAPYVQAEFSPSSRLRASAGLRFDTMRFTYEDRVTAPPTPRYLRPASTSRAYGHASPKLGVTYQVSTRVNAFGAYRHAFRVPSEGQLFRQGSSANTVDLKPVRADSLEVGLRTTPVRGLSLQVSAYRLDKRDDILSFRNPVDGATSTVNAGHTLHRGLEVGLDATPVRWVRLSVAYSRSRHTYEAWVVDPQRNIDYSGKEMETAPRHLGQASVTCVPWHRVTASAEVVQLGSYWMDAANTLQYGGHTLVNLRGQAELGRGLTLFARVLNVANRRYAETSSYTLARGAELAPGRPRTAFAGVEFDWSRQ